MDIFPKLTLGKFYRALTGAVPARTELDNIFAASDHDNLTPHNGGSRPDLPAQPLLERSTTG